MLPFDSYGMSSISFDILSCYTCGSFFLPFCKTSYRLYIAVDQGLALYIKVPSFTWYLYSARLKEIATLNVQPLCIVMDPRGIKHPIESEHRLK